MYCTECYRQGAGSQTADFIYNGKSLCYTHLWEEGDRQPLQEEKTKVVAIPDKPKVSRGTRLPGDDGRGWMPTQESIDKIKGEFPNLTSDDIALEHRQFLDWAYSSSSRNAVKKNWDLAWRNWMRRQFKPGRSQPARRTNDDKVQGWLDVEV